MCVLSVGGCDAMIDRHFFYDLRLNMHFFLKFRLHSNFHVFIYISCANTIFAFIMRAAEVTYVVSELVCSQNSVRKMDLKYFVKYVAVNNI